MADPLDEADLDDDPIVVFTEWFAAASDAGETEPEAMALATASADGAPAVRWVLLKSWDRRGFVFFTNNHSAKGADLAANPRVALGFRWARLDRQVRVTGPAEPVGPEEADAYFASRERRSQIGAWASQQSTVLGGRRQLDDAVAEVEARFDGVDVPRPPHWSGWRVRPERIEFWQARANRLHDRIRYRADGRSWQRERLSP